MLEHSIFSASSSSRWTKCPGSIKLSLKMPEQQNSSAAQEGTDAHEVADFCLKSGLSALTFVGKHVSSGAEITESIAKKVQGFVDYVNKFRMEYPGDFSSEQRVYLKNIDDRAFGTADAILISPSENHIDVHVFDLKFGKWKVDPENNEQLMYYCLGALEKIGFHRPSMSIAIYGHIYQPNALDIGMKRTTEPGRFAKYSLKQLADFADLIKASINKHNQFDPDNKMKQPPLFDGEHCRFCRADLICPQVNRLGRKVF